MLGTIGHRSGTPRATPPGRPPRGGRNVAGGGQQLRPLPPPGLEHQPSARPQATVTARGHSWQVSARRLTAEEKGTAAQPHPAGPPFYDTYAARAGRDIRVFCLTPRPRRDPDDSP
ncbi:nitroreductase/quinone reductase family protein [Streptomyces iakyrus]